MATIATRNSTFIDAATPARPIANTTSARKTADAAPAAQIAMVKVPAAASISSMFLTFRVHSAPHHTLSSLRGRVRAAQQERTSVPQPPGDGCESPMDQLGTPQLIAP